jgi:hypothetical protein
MWFFLRRSKRIPFYPEHQISPATHKTFYSVDVVDPSPVLKELMHEADHSPLLSAEVADQCCCNCASAECLQGVDRDNFTFYHCVGGMTPVSTWTHLCPAETIRYGVKEYCVILQYCVVSKHRKLLFDDQDRIWRLGNLCACWFSFCIMLIYCSCLWPIYLL